MNLPVTLPERSLPICIHFGSALTQIFPNPRSGGYCALKDVG